MEDSAENSQLIMSNYIGKIEEFNSKLESWSSYQERIDIYFDANSIIDDKKKTAILLTTVGRETYNILRNLTTPEKPSSKNYADLVKILNDHYDPVPNVTAERYRFNQRKQREDESITEFITELKRLSINCNFDTDLEDRLRDRIVDGVKSETILRKLLAESALTFQKASSIALAMEAATKDAIELRGPQVSSVNRISSGKNQNFKKPQNIGATSKKPCFRCGKTSHHPSKCFALNSKCNNCFFKGHYANMCKSKNGKKSKPTHKIETSNPSEKDNIVNFFAFKNDTLPIILNININQKPIAMELDTGSEVSIISEQVYKSKFPDAPLSKSDILLKPYMGPAIKPIGKFSGKVSYENQNSDLIFHVVQGNGSLLLGREFLQGFKVNWTEVHKMTSSTLLKELLADHDKLFKPGIGVLKGRTVKIDLVDSATPKFCKPRPVPFCLKSKIEAELSRLEEENIIQKVHKSDWGTPVVPILKKNGEVRICGDYKVTVNPQLKKEKYPLPTMDELFAKLANGKKFTKLDVRWAYLHIMLDEESQNILTISTHKGLYKVKRLPFGITTSAEIFQRTIEEILLHIDKVGVMQDDVIVTGETEEEHLANLKLVLDALMAAGFKLNKEKCKFMMDSIEYLGYQISKEGLQPTSDKLNAIMEAPRPHNVTQLRSFLGLINFYGKFVPNLATVLHALHDLLKKNQSWKWENKHEESFQKVKSLLKNSEILAHFDPTIPVELMCDASSYGLGAVLAHRFPNGNVKPIAFVSRSLNSSQKNYSQIDKEALAIIFGVRKFHKYIFGLKFTLWTDHKPLISIFNPSKGIPDMIAARMQRWSIILSTYNYDIKYVKSCENKMADLLSRYPVTSVLPVETAFEEEIRCLYLEKFSVLPVTANQVATETARDPILSRVLRYVQHGWTDECGSIDVLKSFYSKCGELTTEQGCLLWGMRVVIPKKLRNKILTELHDSHLGIVKVKSLARQHVWWPSIDSAIEELVNNCQHCIAVKKNPPHSPLHPWEWPMKPWQRLHIDFAGPMNNINLLLLVDAHSKWPEVIPMTCTTAKATILQLKLIFARFGLPERIVTDNGPQFSSEDFKNFTRINGIRHTFSAPYHPATNGAIENFVGTAKRCIKANISSGLVIEEAIIRFLSSYRSVPHSTTGVPPCQLMLGRLNRSRLDLLHPQHLSLRIRDKQETQIKHKKGIPRKISIGDFVLAKDYRKGRQWQRAIVHSQLGKSTFILKAKDGTKLKRHIDQMWLSGPDPRDQLERDTFEGITEEKLIRDQHLTLVNPKRSILTRDDLSPTMTTSHHDVRVDTSITAPNVDHAKNPDPPPSADELSDKQTSVPAVSTQICDSPHHIIRRSSRIKRPPQKLNL